LFGSSPASTSLRNALLGVLVILCASCAGRNRWPNFPTQKYPAPMPSAVDPLPPGAEQSYPPGPEEVVVARLADPVKLMPAGQHSAFPLRFFDKRRRANAGAWVFSSPGGRAEVIWPNGSTAVLFDRCTGIVGSPSRGEPNLILREIDRVVLELNQGDQIELLGGAILAADSGPWVIFRKPFEILRVKNQSKKGGEVAYRDEVFEIGAGETIDLPLLSSGGTPIPETPGTREVAGPGFLVEVYGKVDAEEVPGGVRLTTSGEHEISGLGVRVHLDRGEVATLSGLSGVGPAPVPDSRSGPEPESAPAPEVEEAPPPKETPADPPDTEETG